jgi:hypothetical protein
MCNKFIYILLISCGLFLRCSQETSENNITVKSNPTFEDIAPIIYKNCTPCHRAGESGPIEFMTYDDVKKNVNKIKFVTQSGYMPPWPADDSYTHFIGERKLSKEELQLIKVWAENGAPKGDESKIPAPPVFYAGSFLGKPDTVIKF